MYKIKGGDLAESSPFYITPFRINVDYDRNL